jgi:cellulose synthase/poly-beta-1,6-N-acetylglucosamine synthase-like glycosyltransferase
MKIDVIIPVRNQTEKLLRNLASDIIPYFDGTGLAYDILICADHSSPEQFEKLLKKGSRKHAGSSEASSL